MEKNKKYKDYTWEKRTKYQNEIFCNFDFTSTIFENASFTAVTFEYCLFDKSNMNHIGLWNGHFINCLFLNVDLRNMPIGAESGLFSNCVFEKCDLRGHSFWYPHFKECIFEKCKLKKIDFNDSSFENCKFIGKIEDVTFNGMYHENSTGHTPLENVDFSEAIFGDYVSFEDCDLSTCTPPNGKTFDSILYIIDETEPRTLSTGDKERTVITAEMKEQIKNL